MRTTTKVIYKPDSQSTDEFIVIVGDADALTKWRDGDKTIPLVDVVDSFDVFHTGQGAQGLLDRAPKSVLDSVFGTTNEDDIVKKILSEGRVQSGSEPGKYQSKNDSRAGERQVSKGGHSGGR